MTTEQTGSAQPKVGLLVEGDVDKLIVEALARKVAAGLAPSLQPRLLTIRLSGSPQVRDVVPEVLFLLDKACRPVILVFGTDADRQSAGPVVTQLESDLGANRLLEQVRLVPVTPSIESWVLADEDAVQQVAGTPPPPLAARAGKSPKEVLKQWLGRWDTARQEGVSRLLEPARIRVREPSFRKFEQAVQEVLRARSGSQPDTAPREPVTHP